ncbi:MAG: DUF4238 domain-containing protein [Candidatus Scalinduaceae bacterium]
MNNPRNHHYVSRFYLSGFTKSGGSKGKIYVFDKTRKKSFETNPRNVASQRDFNRVEIKGNENEVENALSGFEGITATAFKRIINNKQFPDEEDFSCLINFMCLLAIRNLRFRENFGDAKKRTYEQIMDIVVSNEDIYMSQMKKLEKSTGEKYDLDYHAMKSFIDEKRYTIEIPSHSFVYTELSVFDKVLPSFFKRNWTMLISNSKVGEFVTSDHPITLISASESKAIALGFRHKNTEVAFPISRYLAIVGRYETGLPATLKATPRLVADINGRTINYSKSQIYSSDKNYYFMDFDGEIKNSSVIIN